MHYFSLHLAETEEHIGFFLLQSDNEASEQGQFAIKLNDAFSAHLEMNQELITLSETDQALFWEKNKDQIILFNQDGLSIGVLQQQFLRIHQQSFIINDLTGVI